ncbi:unnamed protein product [Gadus morhua 'NCC']
MRGILSAVLKPSRHQRDSDPPDFLPYLSPAQTLQPLTPTGSSGVRRGGVRWEEVQASGAPKQDVYGSPGRGLPVSLRHGNREFIQGTVPPKTPWPPSL